MRLKSIEIEGYRSITGKVTVHIERDITVILGANDHGKSNILAAIEHLNPDRNFDIERDLSWDLESKPEKFPFLRFTFSLDEKDRADLDDMAAKAHFGELEELSNEDPNTVSFPSKPKPLPPVIHFKREGVASELTVEGLSDIPTSVVTAIKSKTPRVELIKAYDKIVDSVTSSELENHKNEFMRGVFYYAGLDPNNSSHLFAQTDATEMTLEAASKKLDSTLKQSWSQGQNLQFLLNHNSKLESIELKIVDPAVENRRVRASRRSSGFTNYFALKTILQARQREHPAESYILLFDEPGIYLHPSGQFDLLQVIEKLGQQDQVVYVTHSLFLINKTYPTRHRLVSKDERGTIIEGKPYAGRWGSVLSALGLSLTGTILFANQVLLTEGDSDPIYIYALLQRFVRLGQLNVDLNGFAAIATGEARNADALVRLLTEAQPTPRILLLIDGDTGGKDRLQDIQGLLKQHNIPHLMLDQGAAIEDLLPFVDNVYVAAVAAYIAKLKAKQGADSIATEDAKQKAAVSFSEKFGSAETRTTPWTKVAEWAAEFGKEYAQLKTSPSKVGIAREYVSLLDEIKDEAFTKAAVQRSLQLCQSVVSELKIPRQNGVSERIFTEPK